MWNSSIEFDVMPAGDAHTHTMIFRVDDSRPFKLACAESVSQMFSVWNSVAQPFGQAAAVESLCNNMHVGERWVSI